MLRFGQTHGLGLKFHELSQKIPVTLAMQVTKRQSTLVQDGEPAPKKAEPEAIGGVTLHISMESYNTVAGM